MKCLLMVSLPLCELVSHAVALPPEKTDSCSVEERMQDTEGSATVGPHKQLQFEVSIKQTNKFIWLFKDIILLFC